MTRVNYAEKFPKGVAALTRLEQELAKTSLEPALAELVRIRVSEINGCGFCLAMHHRDARARGESLTRLDTVAGWREAPFYTERERAALEWAETLTLLSERGAPDTAYDAVAALFSQEEVAALTFAIVAINSWNRLAVGLGSDPASLDGLDLPADMAGAK
ncbi:carboxymuconolactone decarboxylase family protein [Segeticoccus rhizosphaerae]|jgi:AhpD family alkylhydroperoxidase|uniref:carboxymuconolactone decarboxylase family protein n=1 Tax=Segeticoccus rhizosphaerae TaxID=1104777 RepID=UPI0010C0F25B|nr:MULTISPECIES: carboxymuconolactone decarboxylase family protein [Intrasporangiaceae]